MALIRWRRSRAIVGSLLLATALAASMATASTAEAAPLRPVSVKAAADTGWLRCPTGTFCVFESPNGTGHYAYFEHGWQNFANPIGGFVFNDRISAVWNRAYSNFCVYEHSYYNGGARLFSPGGEPTNLSGFWNDRISSTRSTWRC